MRAERPCGPIQVWDTTGCDAAQVAAAPFGRTRTRRCPSCRRLQSRIRHRRSRPCCRSVERAGASAALGSRGDTVGRRGWSPRTRRSYRADAYLNFTHGPAPRPGTLNLRLEILIWAFPATLVTGLQQRWPSQSRRCARDAGLHVDIGRFTTPPFNLRLWFRRLQYFSKH